MSIQRIVHRLSAGVLVVVAFALASCGAEHGENLDKVREAASVPSGFSDETFATGLQSPTAMAFAPDGRLFVCQQGGQLRVIKNGVLLATPFVTVSTSANGERGLLGIAFDPGFASNRFVYLYYTAASPSVHNRVSRFTANGDVATAGSETILLELENLSSATNHNGGAMHFGPDGKLFVAVGENADRNNAQTLSNRLGKVLRVNPDGSIPSDNPFFASATGENRAIWTLGLRNPFTFSFQPGTGRMFINDVGEQTWEEINDGIAGSNYGWPTTEGSTTDARFRSPLFAYGHGAGDSTGCAITGGVFYNPTTSQFPSSFVGKYLFADYCNDWIRVFDPASGTAQGFATAVDSVVDLRVGPDGLLYYLARGAGAVGRIRQVVPQTRLNPTSPLAFPVRINFQLLGAPTPSGYVDDTGLVFGSRSGLSFGWNVNHTDVARDRNVNANQLLDTLLHFHVGGVWEVALPYGRYNVLVSIGDASFASTHTLNIEGMSFWNGRALGANQFVAATNSVLVSDGRLTANQGGAADKATRINYLEVSRP